MFKTKSIDEKVTPKMKILDLKNISVKDLVLIDTDTGEDITAQVIAEIPKGIDTVDFKLTFKIDKSDSEVNED
jgi:hypothetical protein